MTHGATSLKLYRKGVDIMPKACYSHFYLGRGLIAAGNKAEGKSELMTALSLNPDAKLKKMVQDLLDKNR